MTWRPEIVGWSEDVLPYYEEVARNVRQDAVIVELGVHSGRSAIYLAEQLLALGKKRVAFYAIDWWQGADFRKQILDTYGRRNFAPEVVDMIRLVRRECDAAAGMFRDESLDMVFIDSDHSHEGMRGHLLAWHPKVRPGGIVAGHDYSAKDWPGVVKAVDDHYGAERVKRYGQSVWEVTL